MLEIITLWQDRLMMNICHRIMGEEVPFLDLEVRTRCLGETCRDYSRKIKGENESWDSWISFKKKSSGEVAKDRLKLLLISDRADCSPDVMETIKNDIIQVISKYMDIDSGRVWISRSPRPNRTANNGSPFRHFTPIFRFKDYKTLRELTEISIGNSDV